MFGTFLADKYQPKHVTSSVTWIKYTIFKYTALQLKTQYTLLTYLKFNYLCVKADLETELQECKLLGLDLLPTAVLLHDTFHSSSLMTF